MNQPVLPLIDKLMYFADEYKKAEFPSIACADLRLRLRDAVLDALAHPPAGDNRLREALANLYHSLPDVLPAAGVERLRATGKWAAGDSYAKRGHTGTVEYRADDMEAVYAAMDDARAALATEQGDRNG